MRDHRRKAEDCIMQEAFSIFDDAHHYSECSNIGIEVTRHTHCLTGLLRTALGLEEHDDGVNRIDDRSVVIIILLPDQHSFHGFF
jgi:hypothetical protein